MKKNKLFDEFEDISSKAWKQKIQFDLRGTDYNEALLWNSAEGIQVKPFYHYDEPGISETKIPHPDKWYAGQLIFAANEAKANQKAVDAIAKGAESLTFTIPTDKIKVEDLLNGIDLRKIRIHFNFQFLSVPFVEKLMQIPGLATPMTHLNIDTIGHLASTGNWYNSLEQDQSVLALLAGAYPNVHTIATDMSLYQNAGANIVQQLAYGLAHANEYLNLSEQKSKTRPSGGRITFNVAIGGNYFFEIAKLRALRLLWRSLADAYNCPSACHITASPSRRNKTIYDYNTNMIRTTMEYMAAILGGANTINCLPYDGIYNKDNEFGARIARNQLLILKHESHLDKVANAADGAYYIEKLTVQLAQKALALFKDIEAGGGFLKQLKEHNIQKKITESAEKEYAQFKQGMEVLVGTNVYRNETDAMKDNLQLYPFVKTNPRKTLIAPIIAKRLAENMEQQRLKNE